MKIPAQVQNVIKSNFHLQRYTVRVKGPDFNMTILMIDTVEYCGNTKYEEEDGQPDEMLRNHMKFSDQRDYIEQQLKNNKYVFYCKRVDKHLMHKKDLT